MSLTFYSDLPTPDNQYLIWTREREIQDFIRSTDQSLWQDSALNHPNYIQQNFLVNAKLYLILQLKYEEYDKNT
jgi:hypothetical protein